MIEAQGKSLGLSNEFISASWNDYENLFITKLPSLTNCGIDQIIFGDIYLITHRAWEEKICTQAGMGALLPLWNKNRLALVHEFLDTGFKAKVVYVDGRFLDQSFVGRDFDNAFIASLPKHVDACGENEEFHTFVYDGPNFKQAVAWKSFGTQAYTPPEGIW